MFRLLSASLLILALVSGPWAAAVAGPGEGGKGKAEKSGKADREARRTERKAEKKRQEAAAENANRQGDEGATRGEERAEERRNEHAEQEAEAHRHDPEARERGND